MHCCSLNVTYCSRQRRTHAHTCTLPVSGEPGVAPEIAMTSSPPIHQHTSAYVSIRQPGAYVYVSIRQPAHILFAISVLHTHKNYTLSVLSLFHSHILVYLCFTHTYTYTYLRARAHTRTQTHTHSRTHARTPDSSRWRHCAAGYLISHLSSPQAPRAASLRGSRQLLVRSPVPANISIRQHTPARLSTARSPVNAKKKKSRR